MDPALIYEEKWSFSGELSNHICLAHTSYISEKNMCKILSLVISIFDIKKTVKSSAPFSNPTCPFGHYFYPVLDIQSEKLVRLGQLVVALKTYVGFENGTTFHHLCQKS